MTKLAPLIAESDDKRDPQAHSPGSPIGFTAETSPRRRRGNRSSAPRPASAVQRYDTALVAPPATSLEPTRRFKTLLMGAGIGAAVTLALVTVRAKRGKGSALAAAVVKATTYVLTRTSPRFSLIHVAAQTVSRALS